MANPQNFSADSIKIGNLKNSLSETADGDLLFRDKFVPGVRLKDLAGTDVSTKTDKVTGVVATNIVIFDGLGTGGQADSGININQVITAFSDITTLQTQIISLSGTIGAVGSHNSLLGLQGGVSGQYYHLSLEQFSDFIGYSTVAGLTANLQSQIDNITGSGGGSGSYTNATPVPITLGGIEAGTTFSNQTFSQMFDQLLYPYQVPTFSSFTWSGLSTPVEVGVTISGAKTFTWGTTNSANISANSIIIGDNTNSSILASGLANDGSEVMTIIPVTKVTATSHIWGISGVNTHSTLFTKTATIVWQWRRYYGESTTTPLVEADIKALRVSGLASSFATTYAFVGGGYKYFAWSTALGTATTFKDTSNNLPVPMEAPYTVSVTNNGVTQNYYVYRTTNILGGSINIQVT